MTWKVVVIGVILGIIGLFYFGLGRNPREIPSPLVGKTAPQLNTTTVEGKPLTSKDLAGKVYLVSFWATWCTTCKADEPLIDSLGATFKDHSDFMLIGIATQDSPDKVKEYLARGHRKYTNIFDENGKIAIDYGVYGVPETYLVDRKGNIVEKMVGPIPRQRLEQRIRELLAADKAPEGKAG